MKSVKSLLAASTLLPLVLFAEVAEADIYIGMQQVGVNSGSTTTMASGATFASYSGAYGSFELSLVSGADGIAPALLGSTSLNANYVGPGGQLDVYVTRTNIAGPVPTSFESGFTTNILQGSWTVTESTYVSSANALYTGALLATKTFTANGTDVQTNAFVGGGAGPYSVTTRYSLNAQSEGTALSTITVSVVPQPEAYALAMASLGVIGLVSRRRKS